MKVVALQSIIYQGEIKNIGDVFDIFEKDILKDCLDRKLISESEGMKSFIPTNVNVEEKPQGETVEEDQEAGVKKGKR